MTVAEQSESAWLGGLQRVLALAARTGGVFALAGTVAFLALLAYQSLSIPLADRVAAGPLATEVAFVPELVRAVALGPAALWGLRPPTLVAAVALWGLSFLGVTLASGIFWWHRADTTAATLPPRSRLGSLVAFAFGTTLFAGAITRATAGYGAVGWLGTLLVLVAVGRLFVAPVTIVRDGRGPLAAIRWSNDRMSRAQTLGAVVLVLLLGGARNVAALAGTATADPLVGLALSTVVGTAVVAPLHALAMERIYDKVADSKPLWPETGTATGSD